MLVQLTNLSAHVADATVEEHAWLDTHLTFEDGKSQFVRYGGKTHRKPPKRIGLYENKTFPAGLTAKVRRDAKEKGFKFDVIDKRVKPAEAPDRFDEIPTESYAWLYDYQVDSLRRCLARTRGILHLPTGSGKTEIAVALANVIPCRWLFLVDEMDLMYNAARRFEKRTGEKAGRIGDGHHDVERFTVATFQSIAAGLRSKKLEKRQAMEEFLDSIDGLVVDEVHTLPADSFYRVAVSASNAYYRIGMSGTPLARGDKRSLFSVAATGEVIHRIKPETLMAAGRISRPTIKLVPVRQFSGAKVYRDAYTELVTRSKARNDAVVEMTKRIAKPALVFVQYVEHGKRLTKMLSAAGLNSEFVWGKKGMQARDDAIRRLTWGDLDVIVCNVVFQKGTDIPELAGLVIASAGKSDIAAIQRIGRGMRTTETKKAFEVYDVFDRDARWDDGRDSGAQWLSSHANLRRKAYIKEGYEVCLLKTLGDLLSP